MRAEGVRAAELVAVALGSNLGARQVHLDRGRQELGRRLGRLRRVSRIYETEPVGPPHQGRYLNQVVTLTTRRAPDGILAVLREIEERLGRRRAARWGPRVIDLDLLLWGEWVWRTRGVIVPHPRLHVRAFVLAPLSDVLPYWSHPRGGGSVLQLLRGTDRGGVAVWKERSAGQWKPPDDRPACAARAKPISSPSRV